MAEGVKLIGSVLNIPETPLNLRPHDRRAGCQAAQSTSGSASQAGLGRLPATVVSNMTLFPIFPVGKRMI